MFTGTGVIIGLAIKILALGATGAGAGTFMEAFHNYKFKSKKKGDKDDNFEGETLRERAKSAN
jgi:hypothetical protein